MAQVSPRKQFNFSIQIIPDPINPILCQKVTLPDLDIEQVEHGEANGVVKTGGMVKIGNLKIDKISPASRADSYFFDWADSVQSSIIGGGALPEVYYKTIIVTELGPDGRTPLNTHTYFECWPTKINGKALDRLGGDNTVESIELSVNKAGTV